MLSKYLNFIYIGNIFTWDRKNIQEPENGSLTDMPTWESKSFASFCQDETLLVPFDEYSPDQLDYFRAIKLCRALGGKMAMPTSLQDEQRRWTELFAYYKPKYKIKYRQFLLPVTDNENPDQWMNELTFSYPDYSNWGTLEPNGGIAENCTVLRIWNPYDYAKEFK